MSGLERAAASAKDENASKQRSHELTVNQLKRELEDVKTELEKKEKRLVQRTKKVDELLERIDKETNKQQNKFEMALQGELVGSICVHSNLLSSFLSVSYVVLHGAC